ncbi:MAG: hypothetical protein SPL22_02435 [Treponema sp.]|uniref:hypothetical protein n=1 Tax=Treponema sp. TaxID=166 RepID=UPI002A90F73C|nr:hypothetical protein [Treponema sp.]MDY6396562.1 hypothetical protein [Treponema sp.]
MDSYANDLLDLLDDGDTKGAHDYAERYAGVSDVCAEYVTKDEDGIYEFHRAGSDRREHEVGNPDFW